MIHAGLFGVWSQRKNLIGLGALVLVVATLPLWLNSPYALSNLVLIGLYTLVIIGLNILMGFAGQVSLGQAAFFGLGAYASAILTARFGWSPWTALVAAALGTALIAYIFGIPIFRLSGHYLAMGTLAFGFLVTVVMKEWKVYTGGPTGLPGIPRFVLGGAPIKTDLAYYYLVWAFVLVGLVLAVNLVNSRFGRALRALRESEAAAESLGVRVGEYKLRALVVSALYASVAGSLYAHYMIFVSPGAFDLNMSIRFVLMAAVGGLTSIWGAPLGATVVILISLILREVMPLISGHGSSEQQIIAYGALLVVIMVFMPQGLTATLTRAWQSAAASGRLPRLPRLSRLKREKGR